MQLLKTNKIDCLKWLLFIFKLMGEHHHIFGQLILTKQNGEQLFLSDLSLYALKNVITWKFNRPPEQKRISDIKESILNQKDVDGIIYVAEITNLDKSIQYVCYDGNHRREALLSLPDNYPVLIQVMWDASYDDIKKKFIELNKANPVPELYTEETTDEAELDKIRVFAYDLIGRLIRKWPRLLTTNKNARKPNFNRDNLFDKLSKYRNLYLTSIDSLFEKITETNEKISKLPVSIFRVSELQYKKADENHCFLFLVDDFVQFIDFN